MVDGSGTTANAAAENWIGIDAGDAVTSTTLVRAPLVVLIL